MLFFFLKENDLLINVVIWKQNNWPKWGIWDAKNWKLMNLEFEIGSGIYLCCHNYECYGSMVWEGEKAAVGGYTGMVINEPHHVPPVLEWRWMWWSWMKDAMALRDFLHNNGMILSLMNDENDVHVEISSFFLCFFTSWLLAPSWLNELLCFSTSSLL